MKLQFEREGVILVRKISSLEKVRKKMAGRLPQWSQLEGKADELVLRETRKRETPARMKERLFNPVTESNRKNN